MENTEKYRFQKEDLESALREFMSSIGRNKKTVVEQEKKEYSPQITRHSGIDLTLSILKFTFRLLRKATSFIHILVDKYLAISLYHLNYVIGEAHYYIGYFLYNYIKKNRYSEDDKFEKKLDRERIVYLGFGLRNVDRITIREIMYEFGTSEGYARQILDVAKNPFKYNEEYLGFIRMYKSDSEKNDKRSQITQ